jgi:hypothetical protein
VCGDALNSVQSLPERHGSDSVDSHRDETYVVQELIYVHFVFSGARILILTKKMYALYKVDISANTIVINVF